MSTWSENEFMKDWDETYVSTNISEEAKPYDVSFFRDLHNELSGNKTLREISSEVLITSSCALGRADLAGKWFDDVTKDSTPEQSARLFLRLRESIMCIYPFVGVPACMPACYGMIGVLERKGEAYGNTQRLRQRWMSEEDVEKGAELRAKIYSTAGNSGIFLLMDRYFPDLYNASTAFTWGYLISKANEQVFELNQSHLLVLVAILGLGAKRQMGSHIKATIGIGTPADDVKVLVDVVSRLAEWAGKPFDTPDVNDLEKQVRQAVQGK